MDLSQRIYGADRSYKRLCEGPPLWFLVVNETAKSQAGSQYVERQGSSTSMGACMARQNGDSRTNVEPYQKERGKRRQARGFRRIGMSISAHVR
jgi:hypothetical protein